MKAEVRSYFATPVIIATIADADAINAELKRIILERERQDEGVHHSNLGAAPQRGTGVESAEAGKCCGPAQYGDLGLDLIGELFIALGALLVRTLGDQYAIDPELAIVDRLIQRRHVRHLAAPFLVVLPAQP